MEEEFAFNPELHLDQQDYSELAVIVGMPGFKVLNKIMRSSVDWFVKQWINVDVSDEDKILALHKQSKTAAQFYTLVLNMVNDAVRQYTSSIPLNKPLDSAEGLDIDDVTSIEEEELA